MNIKFGYLYPEGANYKEHHEVVLANPHQIPLEQIQKIITANLIDECWSIAKDWHLPDMHFKEYEWDEQKDHQWHELESIEETAEAETVEMSIKDFLEVIRRSVILK